MTKIEAWELAAKVLDEEGLRHAERVADYAIDSPVGMLCADSDVDREILWIVGILHDVVEDTDLGLEDLGLERTVAIDNEIYMALRYLSKPKWMEYEMYCKNIDNSIVYGKYAYIVKMADIKDHLMLENTLSDRLKEKYIGALRILL